MTLKEFIYNTFPEDIIENGFFGHGMGLVMTPDIIKKFINEIKNCNEFKNVDELMVLELPNVEDESLNMVSSHTIKLEDYMRFKGRCYLYSISLTPMVYNPDVLSKPVKNGASLSPVTYDSVDLTPKRAVRIEFSPEEQMDSQFIGDITKKNKLHEILDDIINNPKEYLIKGDRGIIVRGIFERIDWEKQHYQRKFGILNTNPETQKHFMVSYIDRVVENNIPVQIKQMFIPVEFKELFVEEFKDSPLSGNLDKKILNEFLYKHNINPKII